MPSSRAASSFPIDRWNASTAALPLLSVTFVPAQPGFTIARALMPGLGDGSVTYTEEPVTAFRVAPGAADEVMPIAVSGETTTFGNVRWTVRQPNGCCHNPDGRNGHLDEFKADCEQEAAKANRKA